jgi:hypothetical protein
MGGRGARIVVDPLLGLEDLDRKTLARQRQRRDDADRPAAGNENGTLGRHFPAFYAGRSVAAIRAGGSPVGQYPLYSQKRPDCCVSVTDVTGQTCVLVRDILSTEHQPVWNGTNGIHHCTAGLFGRTLRGDTRVAACRSRAAVPVIG